MLAPGSRRVCTHLNEQLSSVFVPLRRPPFLVGRSRTTDRQRPTPPLPLPPRLNCVDIWLGPARLREQYPICAVPFERGRERESERELGGAEQTSRGIHVQPQRPHDDDVSLSFATGAQPQPPARWLRRQCIAPVHR